MRTVRSGTFHELRLLREGRGLRVILRRLARAAGFKLDGVDDEAEKLNFRNGYDIVGLTTVQMLVNGVVVTVITAPGAYFGDKRGRALIGRLAKNRRASGRAVAIVSKHELIGKAPLDLRKKLRDCGVWNAGLHGRDRMSASAARPSRANPPSRPILTLVSQPRDVGAINPQAVVAGSAGV